jgi:uncharacterized membrane protein YeiH
MLAVNMNMSIYTVMVAAVLTGAGGGVIRDLLAGRRPLIFKSDIYAVWAASAGLFVGIGLHSYDWALYALLVVIAALRILSYRYHWELPRGKN